MCVRGKKAKLIVTETRIVVTKGWSTRKRRDKEKKNIEWWKGTSKND